MGRDMLAISHSLPPNFFCLSLNISPRLYLTLPLLPSKTSSPTMPFSRSRPNGGWRTFPPDCPLPPPHFHPLLPYRAKPIVTIPEFPFTRIIIPRSENKDSSLGFMPAISPLIAFPGLLLTPPSNSPPLLFLPTFRLPLFFYPSYGILTAASTKAL